MAGCVQALGRCLRGETFHQIEPRVRAVFETRPRVYEKVHLIQELATGGDLHSLVGQQGALPELRARHIFRQVASAVQYCHSNSVYHRVR